MSKLLTILQSKGLKIYNIESSKNAFIFECDVYAKPGSKKELIEVDTNGNLVVKTSAKPVDGEANLAIVSMVGKLLGIAKSNIDIIRGDKSKSKRIKILVEITANKNEQFYVEKFTSISKQEA